MEYYLNIIDNTYLNQSLSHYGVLVQNNMYNTVKRYNGTTGNMYMVINEGILFEPVLSNQIRVIPNVRVFKNNQLVFEKITDNEHPVAFHDTHVYNLYSSIDKEQVDQILSYYESNKKIYLKNTESILVPDTKFFAGLASGSVLAETAYKLKITDLVYYDFSEESIEFQQKLVNSTNRKKLFTDNIEKFTLGYLNATFADVEELNFTEIDVFYDYLKNIRLTYKTLDLRKTVDIHTLFEVLPHNGVLWLSNVLHYVSMLNHYNVDRYQLIDRLANEKNIKILPHTRIYYES